MNLPATASKKLSLTATFVLVSLAFVAQDVPAVSLAQPSRSTPASEQINGTYLYGETPQSNQMNKAYVVFQRQNSKVVGAIYSPNSEFDCFTGSQNNKTLNLKSVSTGESSLGAAKINLSKLHQIKSVSANEQRILSACKQAVESPEKR
jgi:hypothetical protein